MSDRTLARNKLECPTPRPPHTGMRALFFFLLIATVVRGGTTQTFRSGDHHTHLLELFSSEGCSSCPPAESWLGALRDDSGLWRDFVPVAFHVDYWDRLGWRDRFARPEFTARQYAYAGAWGSDTVYTPGFVLDGAEWRRGSPPRVGGEAAGVLTVDWAEDGMCRVAFAAPPGEYEVHGAILGAGIVSSVRAGENSGRTLRHDFVVLDMHAAPFVDGKTVLQLPRSPDRTVSRQAIAVWVTRRGDLAPVQATGGWLD